jgi:hypothetical protein
MITLSPASITTSTVVFNGVSSTTLTDTLLISYMELNFPTGSVTAMVQRGTMVNGVFTPNQLQLRINVNSDGTFASQDGTWSGTLPNWAATYAALLLSFENLLLSSGLVTGTAV